MMPTTEERDLTKDFDAQYERLQGPVIQDIERSVCGCDYGGTSWTTREEADRIATLLDLRPGKRLLEVGAGSGWPGLYLAGRTGCDLALVDLPFIALRIAHRRAARERLPSVCSVVGDGSTLPFDDQTYDAISHSDVLCCLYAKLEVLRECRRVIAPTGRMVFTVISISPGLAPTDYSHAVEFGPPFVEAATDYTTMLHRVGWRVDDRVDLTGHYGQTALRYLEEQEARRSDLEEILGRKEFEAQFTRMREKIASIDRGLYRRELYVTTTGVVDS